MLLSTLVVPVLPYSDWTNTALGDRFVVHAGIHSDDWVNFYYEGSIFSPPRFPAEAGHSALIYRKAKRGCYVVRASMAFRQGAEGDPGLSDGEGGGSRSPEEIFPDCKEGKELRGG